MNEGSGKTKKFRQVGGRFGGYARPKYAEGVTGQPSKSIEEVAGEVIQGKYANGKERRKKLCDMGYDTGCMFKGSNMTVESK